MQLASLVFVFVLVLALSCGEKNEAKNAPEELLISLVLHVKRSDDGAQLVVDLAKSQQSSSVIRTKPKPIVSLSTDLPLWRSTSEQTPMRRFLSSTEEFYDAAKLITQSNAIRKRVAIIENNPVQNADPQIISKVPQQNSNTNGFKFNQYYPSTVYYPTTSKYESGPRNDKPQYITTTPRPETKYYDRNSSISRIPPKLEFKISIGGMTTKQPERYAFDKPNVTHESTTMRNRIDTVNTNSYINLRPDHQPKPPSTTIKPTTKNNIKHDTESYINLKSQTTSPNRDKTDILENNRSNSSNGEGHYSPRNGTTENANSTIAVSSAGGEEVIPESDLVDKAVADQGFGVLASRCESFGTGLVSDGAGGCTKPVIRPKNKNYPGTYSYRSAADNEVHSDVKDQSDGEVDDRSDENIQIRLV